MSRLGISVEGATEREFVSRILRPHLTAFGWTQVVGVDLGGNISLDKIAGVLPKLLGSFSHVSTLYDFYGFKYRNGMSVDALEAAIADRVDPPRRVRLTPYLQLHEFEALLFATPDQTHEWLGGPMALRHEMQAVVAEKGSPEAVNDSPQTSPSHRIKALFPQFDKKLHGPEIIELAGLQAVRAQCPRFDAWIDRLEALGQQQAG
jgi:hypothetical protein